MPLQPTMTRLVRRRIKSAVASSSICSLSNVLGLKFQLKPSRVLSSAKCACRMRRATARSRRASASAPNRRSRKLRCEKLSFSARASTSSSVAAWTGIRRAAKCLRHRSRNWLVGVVWVDVFACVVGFIVLRRFLQQRLVLGRGARGQASLAQDLIQLLPRFHYQRFFCRARFGLCRQGPLHGRGGERAVAGGPLQRPRQILAAVHRKESQNPPRLVLSVAPGAQQSV